MYRPRTNYEWSFLGVMATQAVGTIVLDVVVLTRYLSWVYPDVYQVPRAYVVPIHFTVFVLGNIWQAILAFDALRARNSLQLFGICLFNFCAFVFCVMRYSQTAENAAKLEPNLNSDGKPIVDISVDYWKRVQPALLTSAILVGACSLVLCVLAYKLTIEFAWAIYRHISGSIDTRRRYLAYQVLLVLLKLEVYFFVAFVIEYGIINVHYEIPEFPLTMALIPLLLVQVALTIYSIKRENKMIAISASILRFGEMAYLISRIVALCGKGLRSFTLLKNEMLLFGGVAVVLATLACINAVLCISNFNRGLRPVLQHSSWKRGRGDFEPVHAQARFSERIELD